MKRLLLTLGLTTLALAAGATGPEVRPLAAPSVRQRFP